jgi:arsenite methyltransferase
MMMLHRRCVKSPIEDPPMNDGRKTNVLARAATALAIVSCYGTMLLVAALSLLGISLAINERAWAGAISGFAALAVLAIAASFRRHRSVGPILVATSGLALILWAMYGSYSRAVELAGFVLLIVATVWDWRMGARSEAVAE